MRIDFTREGTRVVVTLTIWITMKFPFSFECGSEWAAHLLVVELDRRFRQQVENIRREEYDAGWRDHRKRAKKAVQFRRFFA